MNLLVTGCAGFIGSHAVEAFLMAGHTVIGVDKMTYAGKPENMKTFINKILFYKADISDCVQMQKIISDHNIDWVINFAAESHVDRSIDAADQFLHSNIGGVHSLLEACRKEGSRMFQISTDEVYGSTIDGSFVESAKLCPRNPYSATKAAAEHLVTSYYTTHGVEYKMVRMSNNFGPRQHREKLLPTVIHSISKDRKIPVYGNGKNIRDWLYVKDSARAIKRVLIAGIENQTYNISYQNEMTNIQVISKICNLMNKDVAKSIKFIKDRAGHDFRYSICNKKMQSIGLKRQSSFEKSLKETVDFYIAKSKI